MASKNEAETTESYDSPVYQLAKANNDFAVRTHQQLVAAGENVFFSPFSLSVAMSMLLRGTKEETADEISKVLGFDSVDLPIDKIHCSFGNLISAISDSQGSYKLAIANAIACAKSFSLKSEYKSDLKEFYKASTWEMDFSRGSQAVTDEINDWVKVNTHGKIPKLLEPLNPGVLLVLLNAVYFKGSWEHQFNTKRTQMREFYNRGSNDSAKSVDMMTMKERFPYMETPTFTALEMSYKGDNIAMLLLLPKERNGLEELEKSLQNDFLVSVRRNLHRLEVTVTLPKFHLEYSKSMKKVFQDLGLSTVFNASLANFKGLSEEEGLEVSEVIHKAVIDVNEEGSEAAAATAVMMMKCCMFVAPEIKFTADHPFLFVIYDKKNNMIFFMGRVNEL